jgi:hypothetical protein
VTGIFCGKLFHCPEREATEVRNDRRYPHKYGVIRSINGQAAHQHDHVAKRLDDFARNSTRENCVTRKQTKNVWRSAPRSTAFVGAMDTYAVRNSGPPPFTMHPVSWRRSPSNSSGFHRALHCPPGRRLLDRQVVDAGHPSCRGHLVANAFAGERSVIVCPPGDRPVSVSPQHRMQRNLFGNIRRK